MTFENVGTTVAFTVKKGETLDIRVLVDRPIIEAFVQGGRAAFTYGDTKFDSANAGSAVFNTGTTAVAVVNATGYGMECGWNAD